MSARTMVCPQCKTELTPGDPEDLCPRCLIAAAVGSGFLPDKPETETAAARIDEITRQDVFGPYRILIVLGQGGMGTVYLAEQTEPFRRRVALKVVKQGMDTDQVLARFNHERQSLARMEHTNIARILDAGASSLGQPFIVMEYIDGEAITLYCDRQQLTTTKRLELFLPVCRAIQHAHDKGVIHRDIKPSNVLVSVEDGQPVPKVIDFGIARAMALDGVGNTLCTQFGQMVGTPEYASPEQADMVGGEIGAATDVYSLGVLLYEMLIGAVPFDGALLRKSGLAEMLRIIREEEPPSLLQKLHALGSGQEIASRRGTDPVTLKKLLQGDLNWIVKRALEKSPKRRYGSPAELVTDIERYLRGEPVVAGPSRRPRRIRELFLAATAVFVLATGIWLLKRALDSGQGSRTVSKIVLSDLTNDTGDTSFERIVRQSIGFELQRSGRLNLLPETRVAEILREMRRSPGTRLTPEIAREVCERAAGAAVIETSLTKAGSKYALTLRARNCVTEALLDEEQSSVATRDGILNELGPLTLRLQSKADALMATAQRSTVPLAEATTSSLEALKFFSAVHLKAYEPNGVLLLRRAIELDPQFALAYAHLGLDDVSSGEQNLAMGAILRAYQLRAGVSERENFFITYNYDREVLRNLELARQLCDAWIERYPNDWLPHSLLSGLTSQGTGQYEKAIEEGEKAISVDPDTAVAYENIAAVYLSLNQTEKAKATLQRGMERKLPFKDHMGTLFFAAFLNRDRAEMEKSTARTAKDWPQGDSEHFQSLVAAFEGKIQQSRQASVQAVTLARQAHVAERAALFEGAAALREALYGYRNEASRHAFAVGQIVNGRDVDFPPAFAFALSGNSSSASAIIEHLENRYQEDTCVRFSYSPAVRALLAINQGRPEKAIEILTVSKAYELAQTGVSLYVHYGTLYPTYVRGLALRRFHKNHEAAAEFQRMLDHPGLLLADPIGVAARLQLARALRDSGETAAAKAAYRDFLGLWKDADANIPILQQAKAEFARL